MVLKGLKWFTTHCTERVKNGSQTILRDYSLLTGGYCMNTKSFLGIPANMRLSPNVGTMLGQRRRRWTNIEPTLGERLVLEWFVRMLL